MNWKKTLGVVAPFLAKAVGGPVGNLALNAIGAAFGIEPTEDAIEKKLTSLTSEDYQKLKAAEQQFVLEMRKLDLDLDRIEAEDRSNARAREISTHDWMPRALGIFVFMLFGALIWILSCREIPVSNRDVLNQVMGILYAAVTGVLGYYFGSSAGSRSKDQTIHSLKGGKE